MNSTVKKLTDIEIDEVSVVDRPANKHGQILFSKAEERDHMEIYDEDGNELDVDDVEHGDIVYDENGETYVFVEDEDDDEPVGKAKYFAGKKIPKVGDSSKASRFAAGEGGIRDSIRAIEGRRDKRLRQKALKYGAMGAGAAGLTAAGAYGAGRMSKSSGDSLLLALSKAASEEDRDAIVAKALEEVDVYKAQTAYLQEMLEQEQDERIEKEYIAKAATYNLPVQPEVLGPILKSVATVLTDEELDVLDELFEAIGEILYEELGYEGTTDGISVIDDVNSIADEVVGKANVTKEQAFLAVLEANPALYDQMARENYGYYRYGR